MGPSWQGDDATLRQKLRRLTNSHIIENPRYGLYVPASNPDLHPIDVRAGTERQIAEFLNECGGIARKKEILTAFGSPPVGSYDYKRITLTLKQSPRFRQDFGRGFWNLSEEDREGLPLLGRWAAVEVRNAWFERGERDGFEDWQHKRDEFFYTVGSAFREASDKWKIGHVVRVPAVRAALLTMAEAAPAAKGEAREAHRKRLEQEARASGVTDPYELNEAVCNGGEGWLEHLYAMFLSGDVRLHLAAPAAFYRSCAEVFEVCPARLSRGEASPLA